MKKTISAILVLSFSISIASGAILPRKTPPLRDGFVIDGVDGKVSSQDEKWFFQTFEPLTDDKGTLAAEAKVEFLPSSTLEKFASVASGENKSFRIWGKFTKYQNTNYIYITYYLPVTEPNIPEQAAEDANDLNEEKIIPDDVLALLSPKRTINLAELKKPLANVSDGVVADRTGFVRETKDGFYFDFDALGRNIDKLSLPLLGCEVLDIMANQQKASADPLRFKISAIATSYKDKNYLLLQRATRTYSHGNFAK
ncbi:MAG: hypothetical protein PHP01_03795 [Phycisphaerae bacterium]|nr:hypothetical protein [Phycisphaerae bacterium]